VDVLLFNLEIVGLSLALVGLHAMRDKWGLAPLYLVLGVTMSFMAIGTKLEILAPVIGGGTARYASLEYLAILLTGMGLVYALEGTREARKVIVAVVIGCALIYAYRVLVMTHLLHSDVDLTLYGREQWGWPGLDTSLISTFALLVDGVAIIVIYQALLRVKGMPHVAALTTALIAATVVDSLIYGGLSGNLGWVDFSDHLIGKVTAGVAAAVPVATYIAFQFRRTPEQLRDGVLQRGAFEIVQLRRQVEEGKEALVKATAEYENVRGLFSRYVAPDVVNEILADTSKIKLGGELRDVTILFSDIRGYSTLSEKMSPEETIELLNRYFGAMSEVISIYRGTIIEFEGDAILCVFGAPLDQPDHAELAVKASLAMLRRVVSLNEEWDKDGTSELWRSVGLGSFKIRIGVHTGPVVVGNIGSHRRTKYAVIGDTVNTAARVEGLNKELRTTLLITQQTLSQITDEALGPLQMEDRGVHNVRGRVEPVHVHAPRELPRTRSEALPAIEGEGG